MNYEEINPNKRLLSTIVLIFGVIFVLLLLVYLWQTHLQNNYDNLVRSEIDRQNAKIQGVAVIQDTNSSKIDGIDSILKSISNTQQNIISGTIGLTLSSEDSNGLNLTKNILGLDLASATSTGALSSGDWNSFNGKQPAGAYLTSESDTLALVTGRGASTLTESMFFGGLVSPKIRPEIDSTTAFQINKADGLSNVLNVDTTNGNVGIGTTNPVNKLEIVDSRDAYVSGIMLYNTSDTANASIGYKTGYSGSKSAFLSYYAANNSNSAFANRGILGATSQTSGLLLTAYNGSQTIDLQTGGTSSNYIRMRVSGSGNVGIGTLFTTGSPADKLTVASGSATIYDTSSLGSEKVANGAFTTVPDISWTWGAGWAHDTTNLEADHTAGNTASLQQNVAAISGEIYQVVFTVKNTTAGSVTPQVGGVNGVAVSSNTTSTQQIRATGTGNLKFTPTSNFDGSIDGVSVKLIMGGNLKLAGLLTGGGTSGIKVTVNGNVGIGTDLPNEGAILDLTSTTKAFLPPRMTTAERDAISSPTAGMMIYNTTTNKLNVYTTVWEAVTSAP